MVNRPEPLLSNDKQIVLPHDSRNPFAFEHLRGVSQRLQSPKRERHGHFFVRHKQPSAVREHPEQHVLGCQPSEQNAEYPVPLATGILGGMENRAASKKKRLA
jgi:hypothetical protein